MSESLELKTELDVWKHLYTQGSVSDAARKRIWRLFNELFPEGHKFSLRETARFCADQLEQGKVSTDLYEVNVLRIHPDALRFLAQYGLDYSPYDWKDAAPQEWELQPESQRCIENSFLFLQRTRLKTGNTLCMVEGITLSPCVPCMDHMWIARDVTSTTAIDWSIYAVSKWTRYLGFPLTLNEYNECCRLITPDRFAGHLLFENIYFPIVQKRLEEIAMNRLAAH